METNDNLEESLKDADLVIIVADHSEYTGLNVAKVGNAVLYDGRGMIDSPMGIGKYMAFPLKVQKSSP